MANRSLLGPFDGTYVLRLSRPGYNVLDTTLTKKQLAFDSRWTSRVKLRASGLFRWRDLPPWSNDGNTDNDLYQIPYGVVLANPMMLLMFSDNGGVLWQTQRVGVTAYNSYFEFRASTQSPAPNHHYRYWVFELI